MKKLVDFYADWCQPCKMMAPIIEELEKEYQVEKHDLDTDQELGRKLGVQSIPTYVIMEDDQEVARFTGVTAKDKLVEALK